MAKKSKQPKSKSKAKKSTAKTPKGRVRRIRKVPSRTRTSNKDDQTIIIQDVVKERRKKRPKSFAEKRAEQLRGTNILDLSALRQQRGIASEQLGYTTLSNDPLTLRRAGGGRYNQGGGVAGFSNIPPRFAGGNLVVGRQTDAVQNNRTRREHPNVAKVVFSQSQKVDRKAQRRAREDYLKQQLKSREVRGRLSAPEEELDSTSTFRNLPPRFLLEEELESASTLIPTQREVKRKQDLKASQRRARDRAREEGQFSQFEQNVPTETERILARRNPRTPRFRPAGEVVRDVVSQVRGAIPQPVPIPRERERGLSGELLETQRDIDRTGRELLKRESQLALLKPRKVRGRPASAPTESDFESDISLTEQEKIQRALADPEETIRRFRARPGAITREQARELLFGEESEGIVEELEKAPRQPQPEPEPQARSVSSVASSTSDSDSSGGSLGGAGRVAIIKPPPSRRLSPTQEDDAEITFFSDLDTETQSADSFETATSQPETLLRDQNDLSIERYAFRDTPVNIAGEIVEAPAQTEEEEQRERTLFFADRPSRDTPKEEEPKKATGRLLRRDRFAPPIPAVRGGPQGLEDTPLERRTIGNRPQSAFSRRRINPTEKVETPDPEPQDIGISQEPPQPVLSRGGQEFKPAPVSSGRGRGRPRDTRGLEEIESQLESKKTEERQLRKELDKVLSRASIPFDKRRINPTKEDPDFDAETGAYVENFIIEAGNSLARKGKSPLTQEEENIIRTNTERILRLRTDLRKLRGLKSQRKKKK